MNELILLAVKMEAEGKTADHIYNQMMELYPDEDMDETDAKIAHARFEYSLFSTKL